MKKVFSNNHLAGEYVYRLQEAEFPYQLIELLNELFDSVCQLDALSGDNQNILGDYIESSFINKKDYLNEVQAKLNEGKFDISDMELLIDLNFSVFTKDFFTELSRMIEKYIANRNELQDFALAEQNLVQFCASEGLPDPSILFGKEGDETAVLSDSNEKRFDTRLLRGNSSSRPKRSLASAEMISKIKTSADTIVLDKDRIAFYTEEDPRVDRYFNNNPQLQKKNNLKAQVLAILDDMTLKDDCDLLFTVYGIVPIKGDMLKILFHTLIFIGYQENKIY